MTDPLETNMIQLPLSADDWPSPPRAAAFTGLAGEIVSTIEPHSESDPLAILAQLLDTARDRYARVGRIARPTTLAHQQVSRTSTTP